MSKLWSDQGRSGRPLPPALQNVLNWYLMLPPAALNENIRFQLRSFSLEDDPQYFHIKGHKLPGICVYFEMKARHIAAQTWK